MGTSLTTLLEKIYNGSFLNARSAIKSPSFGFSWFQMNASFFINLKLIKVSCMYIKIETQSSTNAVSARPFPHENRWLEKTAGSWRHSLETRTWHSLETRHHTFLSTYVLENVSMWTQNFYPECFAKFFSVISSLNLELFTKYAELRHSDESFLANTLEPFQIIYIWRRGGKYVSLQISWNFVLFKQKADFV